MLRRRLIFFSDKKIKLVFVVLFFVLIFFIVWIFLLKTDNNEAEFKEKKIRVEKIFDQNLASQSNSLLIDINATAEAHICIMTRIASNLRSQIPPEVAYLKAKEVRDQTQKLLTSWLSLLRFHKTWTVAKTKFHFYLNDECKTKPSAAVTLIVDVGPVRENRRGDACVLRRVGDLNGNFFASPDDRICLASYDAVNRIGFIAAGGSEGDSRATARVLGRILGYNFSSSADQQKLKAYSRKVGSLKTDDDSIFSDEDVIGINAHWSSLTLGTPCLAGSSISDLGQELFTSLNCAHLNVSLPAFNEDGHQMCPAGRKYFLSPLGVCIEVDGLVQRQCLDDSQDFDGKSGLCCPRGEAYDPGKYSCVRQELLQLKVRRLREASPGSEK